jgi:hypothetical protein
MYVSFLLPPHLKSNLLYSALVYDPFQFNPRTRLDVRLVLWRRSPKAPSIPGSRFEFDGDPTATSFP